MKMHRKESDVLREVMRLLSARGIMHFRQNVGAVKNARGQHVKFGEPGMSDVLAFPKFSSCKFKGCYVHPPLARPLFIECKSSNGKQSPQQRVFQRAVEAIGMTYLLVRSADEVNTWLTENCE